MFSSTTRKISHDLSVISNSVLHTSLATNRVSRWTDGHVDSLEGSSVFSRQSLYLVSVGGNLTSISRRVKWNLQCIRVTSSVLVLIPVSVDHWETYRARLQLHYDRNILSIAEMPEIPDAVPHRQLSSNHLILDPLTLNRNFTMQQIRMLSSGLYWYCLPFLIKLVILTLRNRVAKVKLKNDE